MTKALKRAILTFAIKYGIAFERRRTLIGSVCAIFLASLFAVVALMDLTSQNGGGSDYISPVFMGAVIFYFGVAHHGFLVQLTWTLGLTASLFSIVWIIENQMIIEIEWETFREYSHNLVKNVQERVLKK